MCGIDGVCVNAHRAKGVFSPLADGDLACFYEKCKRETYFTWAKLLVAVPNDILKDLLWAEGRPKSRARRVVESGCVSMCVFLSRHNLFVFRNRNRCV